MVKTDICVFTGSRAEFGILSGLIKALKDESRFRVRILVGGSHSRGTYQEIIGEGLAIDALIKTTPGDTSVQIAAAFGLGVKECTAILEKWRPDFVIILGDRFEALGAALGALFARIPVVHVHGGETSAGVIDEAMRHAITKMSWLHFTSTEAYRRRVIQLGEDPGRVFNVGALGVENAKKVVPLPRPEFESRIGLALNARNLLITFHPATLEPGTSLRHCSQMIRSLDGLKKTHLIFTAANGDMEGEIINRQIAQYVRNRKRKAVLIPSMGYSLYMTAMHYVDAVVGNSSSGIIEAPSFRIGTINIGARQAGRIQATSVINCAPDARAITRAIRTLYSSKFQSSLRRTVNPYDKNGTAARMVSILKRQPLEKRLIKNFYDLETRP